jgi:hypothetical protein
MSASQSQAIERLRRTHPEEWLLIAVDRFDPKTTTPVRGRLLAHSKFRDSLEKRATQRKGLTYLVFGSDTFPEGYAAAF